MCVWGGGGRVRTLYYLIAPKRRKKERRKQRKREQRKRASANCLALRSSTSHGHGCTKPLPCLYQHQRPAFANTMHSCTVNDAKFVAAPLSLSRLVLCPISMFFCNFFFSSTFLTHHIFHYYFFIFFFLSSISSLSSFPKQRSSSPHKTKKFQISGQKSQDSRASRTADEIRVSFQEDLCKSIRYYIQLRHLTTLHYTTPQRPSSSAPHRTAPEPRRSNMLMVLVKQS